jgi:parvulin-like peptidyl-prolyl isomerase
MEIKLSLPTLFLVVAVILAVCTSDPGKVKAKGSVSNAKVVVARVNGEPLYKSDVLRRMQAAYGSDIEEVKKDSNRWQALLDVATETEIVDELLLQNAVADGMTVSTEEASELLNRTRKMAGDPAFDKMLKERGVSEEAFQNFLAKRELINRYKDKLFNELTVNEDALQEYYEGHVEVFAEPDQVRLEVFTFGVSETAVKNYDRWKNGESFDTIVEMYMAKGEQVGRRTRWMPIEAVPIELQPKVAGAEEGTILEPEQISDKFYVVRIVEKMGSRTRGLEEVKNEISKTILNLRRTKTLDDWYKVISQKAKIEYIH